MRKHVLDNGFVTLLDHMGCDADIAASARVSYGNGTKTLRDDRALIRYLMRHQHTSPFEMAELKFHVKAPIFVARQWFRHRTASVNEVSARYSQMPNEYYIPEVLACTGQSTTNKQGSNGEEIQGAEYVPGLFKAVQESAHGFYERFLKTGLRRELARSILPVGLYTEFVWKIDLHNLLHFLKLRLDEHAQMEIIVYAKAMADMVSEMFPDTWEAFQDYCLEAKTFSKQEMSILGMAVNMAALKHMAEDMSIREKDEFLAKLPKKDTPQSPWRIITKAEMLREMSDAN